MQSRPQAIFELPDGARFSLLVSGEWEYDPSVPNEVKQMIELTPAHQYEHPVTHDLDEYIQVIATLTGATIAETLRPDEPPSDVVF